MYSVIVQILDQNIELKLIYKTNQETEFSENLSKDFGLVREGIFYSVLASDLASELGIGLAKVYSSKGNVITGQKEILLEDLSQLGLQSGYLFGPKVPINYDRRFEIDQIIGKFFQKHNAVVPSPEIVASATLSQIAKIHRKYWCDKTFVQNNAMWLSGSKYGICSCPEDNIILSLDQVLWEKNQKAAVDIWFEMYEKIKNKQTSLIWDENVIACMNASIKKINWNRHLEKCKLKPFTFVHRDLHAGNVFWIPRKHSRENTTVSTCSNSSAINTSKNIETETNITVPMHDLGTTILLDWEVCGVGWGPRLGSLWSWLGT